MASRKAEPVAPIELDMMKVSNLKFGHDAGAPGGGVNSRSTGRDEKIEEMAASIEHMGLIQPLAVVVTEDGVAYTIDGNRRLAGLKWLVKNHRLPKDHRVPVIIQPLAGDHIEASLAANIIRVPLHPVDQVETFSGLADRFTPEQIAERFGVSLKLVRARIALGNLAPEVRKAWRAGRIELRAAQMFALEKNQDRQAKVLEDLSLRYHKAESQILTWQVEDALGLGQEVDVELLEAVGRDRYIAAGGELVEDLFSERVLIKSPEIITKLGEEMVDGKVAELLADGWAFAVRPPTNRWKFKPYAAPWSPAREQAFRDLEAAYATACKEHGDESAQAEALSDQISAMEDNEDIVLTADDRAKCGCFVWWSGHNGLRVETGYFLPEQASTAGASESVPPQSATGDAIEASPTISAALAMSLSEQRTKAAADALACQPAIALIALVAALETIGGPVRVRNDGYHGVRTDHLPASFAERVQHLQAAPAEEVSQAIAAIVATTLDLRLGIDQVGSETLIGMLGKNYTDAARETFAALDYFTRASATVVKVALAEMGAPKVGGTKPKLVEKAVELARETGWLPPELRAPASTAVA
ncbi:MAG: hypothetical protein JWM36_3173 [Hyphomicrobiales bacterium]|nr:hypothetical protein [Hyphomicrobiales bacterium]